MPASPRRTSAPLSPRRAAASNSSSLAHSPARPRSTGPRIAATRAEPAASTLSVSLLICTLRTNDLPRSLNPISRRRRRLPETGRGVSAGDRRHRPRLQEQQGRTLGAPPGGRRRPARRFAALRHHAGYTLLGLRLVLGPQGDAGARRRADTADGTLGSRGPRSRTDQ